MAKIIGHKKPDTDSICSAIVFEYFLKNTRDGEFEVCRLGEINNETKFILDYNNIQAPKLIDKVEVGEELYLIDHNEFAQSVDGIEEAKIKMVVDHHRVANFQTAEPLEMRTMPVGCSSTILYKLFKEENLKPTKEIATLMLSAIISDTLLFKSPTTTDLDIKTAKELEKTAGVNMQEYGMELLKAGTNLDSKSSKELLEIDAKEFSVGENKYEVAQINTVDIDEMLEKREKELKEEIVTKVSEKELNLFILMITDIVNSNSKLIVIGDKLSLFEEKFNVTVNDNKVMLEGVVSRKKQIVPFL